MSDIFFSHVEEDARLVTELAAGLERAGYTGWYYERDSLPGIPFVRQIPGVIDDAQVVVVVLSSDALHSPHVNAEIAETYKSGKPFIPLLHGLSHSGFRQQRRDWSMMLGAAVFVPVPTIATSPTADVSTLLPRVIAGLRQMNVRPSGTPVAPPAPASAPPSAPPERIATPRPASPAAPQQKASPQASAPAGAGAASTPGGGGKPSPSRPQSQVWNTPDPITIARQSQARTPSSTVIPPAPHRLSRRRFLGAALPLAIVGGGGYAIWTRTGAPPPPPTPTPSLIPLPTAFVEVRSLPHGGPVFALAVRASEPRIATGGEDGFIRLWRTDDPDADFDDIARNDWIHAIAFNADGSLLATGSHDGDESDEERANDVPSPLKLWDVSTKKLIREDFWDYEEIQLRAGDIHSLAFSHDDAYLAAGCEDKKVRLWELNQIENGAIEIGHDSQVQAIAFHPNKLQLATGSSDGQVRIINLDDTRNPVFTYTHKTEVQTVAFSSDGVYLASGSSQSSSNSDTNVQLRNLDHPDDKHELPHEETIRGIAFHPDLPLLATGSSDGALRLWELNGDNKPDPIVTRSNAHARRIRAAAFLLDGSMLATAGDDNTVRLWAF